MKAIITLLISICFALIAKSQTDSPGELQGRVYDASTNEGIPFTPLVLEINGTLRGVGETDAAGNYTIKPVLPGSYDLRVQYPGCRSIFLQGIQVFSDRISFQNVSIPAGEHANISVQVPSNTYAQVRRANCTPVRSNAIDENAIAVSTNHSAGDTSLAAGVTQADNTSLVIAGSRVNESAYCIDGIRVRGSIPANSIEQISIITGGLPAKYEYVNSENDFSAFKESGNSLPTHSPLFCLTRAQW